MTLILLLYLFNTVIIIFNIINYIIYYNNNCDNMHVGSAFRLPCMYNYA
jgi:hypothetical protein